jgi:ABC-type transport system involved in multi-copper enzyme maturation permease subunit
MSATLIARNTFREVTRDRLLVGVLAAGAVLLAATQALSPLAVGEGLRLTVDLGLSGLSMLGMFVILVVGTGLVAKELERRTIYNLLSRPITRPAYLVGKWMGLCAALWVVVGVMALALCAVAAARGHAAHGPAVLEAAYMAALELTVMTALAVLFSALSTPVLSALYTLGVYVVGQWSYDLRAFAAKSPAALRHALDAAASVVPNLPLFNLRTLAAGGQLAGWDHLAMATAYAALYAGCVLALAAAAFESRDFK